MGEASSGSGFNAAIWVVVEQPKKAISESIRTNFAINLFIRSNDLILK